MSNLVYPSPSASLSIFREGFRTAADVTANGGVITGGAVPHNGIPLNDAQWVIHTIPESLLTRQSISAVFRFIPLLEANDGVSEYYWVTSSPVGFYAFKHTDGSIRFYAWGTLLSIPYATYGAHWKVGKVNEVAFSSDGATVDAWINGVQVVHFSTV